MAPELSPRLSPTTTRFGRWVSGEAAAVGECESAKRSDCASLWVAVARGAPERKLLYLHHTPSLPRCVGGDGVRGERRADEGRVSSIEKMTTEENAPPVFSASPGVPRARGGWKGEHTDGLEIFVLAAELLLCGDEHRRDGKGGDGDDHLGPDGARVDVVVARVGDVVLQARDRALALDRRLRREPQEGDHREARVLHLLHLHLRRVHAERVEREGAEEARLARRLEALDALVLEHRHRANLGGDERRERHVHRLRARGPPVGEAERLRAEDAHARVHRPAAVHELGLSIPRSEVLVRPEAERVEAVVTGSRAIQVAWRNGSGVPELTLGRHGRDRFGGGAAAGRASLLGHAGAGEGAGASESSHV
mmetsp:Transcript_18558/g.60473  ORF Transcript_18558/g.60473 Transcript_18558/m.60473 type:complete len:366 (-) Transcript_18558:20-1117(-)